ncbi:glycoside hydrolase family 2 TIM barrel-domain containing protein [Agaribacter flavus]|uniref:Glycoside hydrolase family 2 TIM barrel-domain containing protein n=1 Tax=Agaribacter flavus TaxID=1902781 RepID=A0ABV7FMK5_9ALTE
MLTRSLLTIAFVRFFVLFLLTQLSACYVNDSRHNSAEHTSLSGVIVDYNNIPIPHTYVKLVSTEQVLVSDLNGRFSFEGVDANQVHELILFGNGYDLKKVQVSDVFDPLKIRLHHPRDKKTHVRKRINFDQNWRFLKQDGRFHLPELDDSEWRQLDLPHDYSIESEFSRDHQKRHAFLAGGTAWYRKTFTLSEEDKRKRVELQFDGIYFDAEIWVNGHSVGKQREGYTSKYFDLTPFVYLDKNNVIAVRVNNDNHNRANTRWYSGSGIYRHAWLTVKAQTHVKTWGTFITTPVATEEQAQIVVETELVNIPVDASNITLETTIVSPEGTNLYSKRHKVSALNTQLTAVKQRFLMDRPNLWSPEHPAMYYAESRVFVDGVLVDDYISAFGVRSFSLDPQQGFFLNGKATKFKGVCIHHDGGFAVGAAVPDEIWERRLRKLKDIGVNAIRTAHNPTSPELMDMLDRMGFLVMNEFTDKWMAPFNPFHHQDWQKDFTLAVERDRNHPSVIFWSVGNENTPGIRGMDPPGSDYINHGLAERIPFVKQLDPTRIVTSGQERGIDNNNLDEKVQRILSSAAHQDVLGMNYAEQWYDALKAAKEDLLIIGTESYRYYMSEPSFRKAFKEENQWLYYENRPYALGSFIWVGISYMGEGGIGSNSGLFDMAGFKRPAAYLYESMWVDKPMVDIAVYQRVDESKRRSHWGWPDMLQTWNQAKSETVDIVTYTNAEKVELYLNDKLLGEKRLSDHSNKIINWQDIKWQSGVLKAVAKNNGKVVAEKVLRTAGKPAAIQLVADKTSVLANSKAVIQVEAYIVDSRGVPIPEAETVLHFSLSGSALDDSAKLLGFSNGDVRSEQLEQRIPPTDKSKQYTFEGRLLAVIEAGDTAGTLTLTASGKGLQSSSLHVEVKAPVH